MSADGVSGSKLGSQLTFANLFSLDLLSIFLSLHSLHKALRPAFSRLRLELRFQLQSAALLARLEMEVELVESSADQRGIRVTLLELVFSGSGHNASGSTRGTTLPGGRGSPAEDAGCSSGYFILAPYATKKRFLVVGLCFSSLDVEISSDSKSINLGDEQTFQELRGFVLSALSTSMSSSTSAGSRAAPVTPPVASPPRSISAPAALGQAVGLVTFDGKHEIFVFFGSFECQVSSPEPRADVLPRSE